jgi:hypothetical protein
LKRIKQVSLFFLTKVCMRAAAGTNEAQQADSGNDSDSHGRNHSHSHGHHGGSSGKDKPGTPAASSNNNNPWVLSAGAGPGPHVVSGFTAATGAIVLITGAVVSWSLATY